MVKLDASIELLNSCRGTNVHIRVSSFYNWIMGNTADATYCKHPYWNNSAVTPTTHRPTTELVKTPPRTIKLGPDSIIFITSNAMRYINIYTCIITSIISADFKIF